jgi:hypothetical protein
MVTLEPNLTFNTSVYYYLRNVKYGNANAYASVDQYAQSYAEQLNAKSSNKTSDTSSATAAQNTQSTNSTENTTAASLSQAEKTALSDWRELIKMLRLDLPENKFSILKLIPEQELVQMLKFLDKDNLLNGMRLFTKDKVLQFIYNIPKEDLLKMLRQLYVSDEQIIDMLPIKELNHFLSSTKINKADVLKIFSGLSSTELAQIAEAATGVPQGKKSETEFMDMFKKMDVMQLTDGIKGLEQKKMKNMVNELLKLNPDLFMEFSQVSLFNETINFTKPDLIKSMNVLKDDQLVGFLTELPEVFLALALTQLDTELFAQLLEKNYQELLVQIMSA